MHVPPWISDHRDDCQACYHTVTSEQLSVMNHPAPLPDRVTSVSRCIYWSKTWHRLLEEQDGNSTVDSFGFFLFARLLKLGWLTVHSGKWENGKSSRRNGNLRVRKCFFMGLYPGSHVFWSCKYLLASSCNNHGWREHVT